MKRHTEPCGPAGLLTEPQMQMTPHPWEHEGQGPGSPPLSCAAAFLGAVAFITRAGYCALLSPVVDFVVWREHVERASWGELGRRG